MSSLLVDVWILNFSDLGFLMAFDCSEKSTFEELDWAACCASGFLRPVRLLLDDG